MPIKYTTIKKISKVRIASTASLILNLPILTFDNLLTIGEPIRAKTNEIII